MLVDHDDLRDGLRWRLLALLLLPNMYLQLQLQLLLTLLQLQMQQLLLVLQLLLHERLLEHQFLLQHLPMLMQLLTLVFDALPNSKLRSNVLLMHGRSVLAPGLLPGLPLLKVLRRPLAVENVTARRQQVSQRRLLLGRRCDT